MSEHTLGDARASLTEPSPAVAAPPPPLLGPVITLDGDAPRLASSTPIAATPPSPLLNDPPPAPHLDTTAEPTRASLDGDAPRLASSTPITTAPSPHPTATDPLPPSIPSSIQGTVGRAPILTLPSPVLGVPGAPVLPAPVTHATPPTLHADQPNETGCSSTGTDPSSTDEPIHPMAHLMPTRQSGPSDASRRAAEKRAIQKAKAKKIKVGVISGIVVVTAVVGPPLARWVIDAVNEAGNTTTVVEPAE